MIWWVSYEHVSRQERETTLSILGSAPTGRASLIQASAATGGQSGGRAEDAHFTSLADRTVKSHLPCQ